MSNSKVYDYILTKTLIKGGIQCKKKLWLDLNEPKKEDESSSIFSGNLFGKKIRELDSSGIDLSDLKYEDALETTLAAIESKETKVIYEGMFISHDTLARADVLRRTKDGWELWEAKAKKVKKDKKTKKDKIDDIDLIDVSIQYYIVSSSGINITKVKLLYLDDEFIYKGDEDYKKLIKSFDVTELVKGKINDVKKHIEDFKNLASSSVDCPKISIGNQCENPYTCTYISSCEAEEKNKDGSVSYKIVPFRSKSLNKFITKKNITIKTNIKKIDTKDFTKTDYKYKRILEAHSTDEEILETELKSILKEYEWPFYFIDFEWIQQKVPIIKYTTSHQNIPFQWSLHKWDSIEKELKIEDGVSFLDFSSENIEFRFIESLLENLDNKGTIFCHSAAPAEIKILDGLKKKESCKKFSDQIDQVILRIKDTRKLAQNHFYNIKMNGKYGLKDIIKSVPSSVSYEEEGNISGGSDAQLAWFKYTNPQTSGEDKEKIKKLLLEYCAKDTYAMYDLVKYWMSK